MEVAASKLSDPGSWGEGVHVLETLRRVAAMQGAWIRARHDHLELSPIIPEHAAETFAGYETDPMTALGAAVQLAEADLRFRDRWSKWQECEQTRIALDAGADPASWRDVTQAVARAMHGPVLGGDSWRTDRAVRAGDRSGAAPDVLRSWLPEATVVVGRATLEVWLDGNAARASAEDKRRYEAYRDAVGAATWEDDTGDLTMVRFAETVVRAVPSGLVLDPRVRERSVHVVRGESLLEILEREIGGWNASTRWTWVAGRLVVADAVQELQRR